MPRRAHAIHIRFSRPIMTLGLVALAATACRPVARTGIDPATTALVVRNPSQFDVNVYALPTREGKPVWLATVPAAGMRSLPIEPRTRQSDGDLVVRTQAIGSSRSWTSGPIALDRSRAAVLELAVDNAGDCSSSRLFTVDARLIGSVMW